MHVSGLLLKHLEYNESCEKFGRNVDMIGGRLVFGSIISIIGSTGLPVKPKLVVTFAVT